ncbi:hypothetical protein M9H77_28612 [Catharanthus roseus]|uniref:Uncharacterized protein n=1 Tax=Catharanthus roseus TaxID=4058 RepID=A0ACC0AI28_CATRO|nr:hypothetical protein M9H77_28612 [Catharanthus roseus]
MASSDQTPGLMPPGDGSIPPGKPISFGARILDKGAQLMQSLKPMKQMSQHVCTFALYSHDMSRQIETHHYVTRLNQDFLQCAVFDSDLPTARLIGVEYIVSYGIFQSLPPEEQKLWHSHAYEIIAGLWVNPRMPEAIQKSELNDLAQTYGKFWCTWQVDRGDRVPLGAPALMMSPQGVNMGTIKPELVQKRDEKYNTSTENLKMSRIDIPVPEKTVQNPNYADYWMHSYKGIPAALKATGEEKIPPGKAMTAEQHMLDKGAQMLQSLKPIKQMSQHACTFALYNQDMTRQIETHHYITRVNQDFLQCAVYDSDDSSGRLIGVEYIVSDKIFETLPADEQKLWHSHAYEIKSGLWVTPRVPEMVVKPELENLAKTYGKFWCTWQTDRGDKLPLGPPALMVSPQAVNLGMIRPDLIQKRDDKYNISTDTMKSTRVEIAEPEWLNPQADYWKQHGKGFAIDVEQVQMKTRAPFP